MRMSTAFWSLTGWQEQTRPRRPTICGCATSSDGGRTWSAPFSPHHDGTKSEHGFASLFEAPGGALGLVWLDGRAERNRPADRDVRPRVEAAVRKTRSTRACATAARRQSPSPRPALSSPSATAPTRDARHLGVASLGETWTEPVSVHHDGWQINGCPVNGPALGASGRDVAVAWSRRRRTRGTCSSRSRRMPGRRSARRCAWTRRIAWTRRRRADA